MDIKFIEQQRKIRQESRVKICKKVFWKRNLKHFLKIRKVWESTAEIGDNNLIRENVTINRGTAAKGRTIVGNNNLLMEGVHVAHDALIGNGCIVGNSTKMAGEIIIDDNAIISANVLMHQFCRVGGYVMIQGGCRFSKDIPPYMRLGWMSWPSTPRQYVSCP